MLSTKHLAEVTDRAQAAGAKLILAGDDRQLASIERGGLFGALKEKHGGTELHEVVRVSDAEQRRAFNLMHQGEFLPALAIYARQGAIQWSGRQDEARAALVQECGAGTSPPTQTRSVLSSPTPTPTSLSSTPLCQPEGARGAGADHRLKTADGSSTLCRGRPDPVYRDRGAARGPASRDRQWRCRDHPRDRGRLGHGPARRQARSAGARRLVCRRRWIIPPANSIPGTAMPGRSTKGSTLNETYLYHSEHWRNATRYVTRHRENVHLASRPRRRRSGPTRAADGAGRRLPCRVAIPYGGEPGAAGVESRPARRAGRGSH